MPVFLEYMPAIHQLGEQQLGVGFAQPDIIAGPFCVERGEVVQNQARAEVVQQGADKVEVTCV